MFVNITWRSRCYRKVGIAFGFLCGYASYENKQLVAPATVGAAKKAKPVRGIEARVLE